MNEWIFCMVLNAREKHAAAKYYCAFFIASNLKLVASDVAIFLWRTITFVCDLIGYYPVRTYNHCKLIETRSETTKVPLTNSEPTKFPPNNFLLIQVVKTSMKETQKNTKSDALFSFS